jgi:hypothetical protein
MMPGQPPSDPNAYAPVAPQGPKTDRDMMLMDYLMQQGAAQPAQQKIAQQRAMAQQLRQGGMQMPGMRSSRSSVGGTVDTAPHPLEMLGSLAQSGAGAYMQSGADQAAKEQAALQQTQLGALRDRWAASQQPPPPIPDQPMGSGY